MATESPKRLSADDRRAQLLEIGRSFFNCRRYADISVDEIAQAAGISKGLLYHYFGSKNEFFLAGFREGTRELLAACEIDPSLSYSEQINRGVEGYLDFVERHSQGYLNLFQDEIAAIPELARVCAQTRNTLMDRFLAYLPPGVEAPATRLALRGYFRFTETVILNWLENRTIDRTALQKLLISSFVNAALSGLCIDLGADSYRFQQLEKELAPLR